MINIHYLYDNTFDGYLTTYYEHYHKSPCTGIFLKETYQVSLLESCLEIETNQIYADKMFREIQKDLSLEALKNIFHCFQSDDKNKEEYIFNYLNLGFKMGREFNNYHTHKAVLPLLQVVNKVKMECHRFLGYIRFTPVGSVLYSSIHPTYNILPIIAAHFADRFRSESFIIHDKNRNIAIISDKGNWVVSQFDQDISSHLKERDAYEDLWKAYFQTVGIEGRKNSKLQQNFVPLKYREDLLEFH